MRRFVYKAKDSKTGKTVKGAIQAETERAAGKLLMEQGYIPETVEEDSDDGLLDKLMNKVTTKDRIVFTRQFSTLIGAGLPLSNSLRTLIEQTKSKPMKMVIEDVLASVEAGKSLYDSCVSHPEVFSKVYLSLIAAGEMSGTLDLALKRLADQEEKDENMMSKIRGALTYPIIVLVVIIAVVVFLMVMVVPQVENLYSDLGEELPTLTAVMVAFANFLIHQWWIILIMLAVAVAAIISFGKTDTGVKFFATFKLKVPMFNKLFERLYMARFARTAQMLLSTGVSMLDSLKIASDAINNVKVEEQIQMAAEKVQAGKPLSESLKDREYMLPLVPQMASIGEETGRIDEMLGRAATVYENELDEQIAAISTMIEPILMVVLAVVAGGIVMAILFPIYSLVSGI